MALASYLSQTRRLLQNPAAPIPLYTDADLTLAINEARQQLAGESASIRRLGTLAVSSINTGPYAFSSIVVSPSAGIASVLNVQTAWYAVGDGKKWIAPRPWEWFSLYYLNNPVPMGGAPEVWSQLGQGVFGTMFFAPIPDINYTITCDTVCLPVDLVDDTTVEAIPPMWTNAVQYYAAYVALLGAQTGTRLGEAEKYFGYYTEFVKRARTFATPGVLLFQSPQSGNPTRANQLGTAPQQGAA